MARTSKKILKFFTKTFGVNGENVLSLHPLSADNRGKGKEIFETLIDKNKTVQKRAVNSDKWIEISSTIKSQGK